MKLPWWALAGNHYMLGEFDEALAAVAHLRQIAEATGDRRTRSMAAWMTGWVHATRGEHAEALEACRQSVEAAADPVAIALARTRLGHAYLESGQPKEAIEQLTEVASEFRRVRFRQLEGMATALLSEAHRAADELASARTLGREAVALCEPVAYPYGLGWAYRALGQIAGAAG